jgi:hypothetical protein
VLRCDEDLEEFILLKREQLNILPNLKEINSVSIKITDKNERQRESKIRKVMDNLWMYVGSYRLVTEEQMDEEAIWYVMDEVGSFVKHSD